MKKLISAVLCLGLVLASMATVSAAIVPSYNVTSDYRDNVQGNKGWYYAYRDGGDYSQYILLEDEATNTRWVRLNPTTGLVQNFASSTGLQAYGTSVANKTAFVWEAPYSGVVTLSSASNPRMSYRGQRAPIEIGIAHTDKDYKLIDYDNEYDLDENKNNDDYVWHGVIAASDDVGLAPYSVELSVSAGDHICFEMGSTSASSATIIWQPTINYTQAAEFQVNGTQVTAIEEVAENSVVDCEINTGSPLDAYTYLMIYDSNGRLREVKPVTDSEIAGPTISTSVTMPAFDANDNETSYEGWSLSSFAITKVPGRFYPINISEKLVLN